MPAQPVAKRVLQSIKPSKELIKLKIAIGVWGWMKLSVITMRYFEF